MRTRTLLISALALVAGFTGCQTIRDNPEIAKTSLRIALRTTAFLVANNNPDLAPYLRLLGGVMSATDETGTADLHEEMASEIDRLDIDDGEKLALSAVVRDALDFYGSVLAANDGQLSEGQARLILEALGIAITEGAEMATDGTVRAGEPPPMLIDTPRVAVAID